MKAKLTVHERQEARVLLAGLANNANVMADKLDPHHQCRMKDGERYEVARHLDAIHKLARAAGFKLGSDDE